MLSKVQVDSSRGEGKVKEGCKYTILKEKEIAGKDRFLMHNKNGRREQ